MLFAYLTIIVLSGFSFAAVLRVPQEHATIQNALDAVNEGDTVIVAEGLYAESLRAPLVSFSLIGDVQPDSALGNLPVVDPSSLPHPDEIACLNFDQAIPFARIEKIAFRNGSRMYPRDTEGGILGEVLHMSLKHCLFDSTYYGITRIESAGELFELDSCRFLDNPVGCVSAEEHRVLARNSFFSGSGFALVNCARGSQFSDCEFQGNPTGYHLLASGDSLLVTFCSFSGSSPNASAFVGLVEGGGTVSYSEFGPGQFAAFALNANRNCDLPLLITGNIFSQLVEITPVVVQCQSEGAVPVRIDSNLFTGNSNSGAKAIQIEPEVTAIISSNRFISLSPANRATIFSAASSVQARLNVFDGTGLAFQAFHENDARFNYWGDSTGPYHPILNPDGLGDRVSDSVLFDPWYPDTSFLINATEDRVELPEQFELSVFPNPFNSTARISLFAPAPFIGSITLTNILGQQVREIHRGPLYGRETFLIAADALPSGIYLLSVRDVIRNTVNSTHKIVLIR